MEETKKDVKKVVEIVENKKPIDRMLEGAVQEGIKRRVARNAHKSKLAAGGRNANASQNDVLIDTVSVIEDKRPSWIRRLLGRLRSF